MSVTYSRREIDRRLFALAIPALGTLAVEPLYVAADTAIIGRVGSSELAGLAAAGAVLSLIVAGSNFLEYGTTERVARAHGAGDNARVRALAAHALGIGMALGILCFVVIISLARPLISLFDLSPETTAHAVRYLQVAAVGLPAIVTVIASQGVLRGLSQYRRPLRVLFASNILNVVLEVPMVIGFGWSVTGSALSTVIAQYVAAALLLRSTIQALGGWSPVELQSTLLWDLMKIGRQLGLRVASMLAVFTGATALAAKSGDVVLAAHQIVNGVFLLLALSLDALAVPAHTLLAESSGADSDVTTRLMSQRVYFWSLVAGVGLAVGVAATSGLIPGLFTSDGSVQSTTSSGLLMLAAVLVPGAIAFGGDGVLIGLGDHEFLGYSAFIHTAILSFALLSDHVRSGPGLGTVWALLLGWMIIRAITVIWRTKYLLNRDC